ncbi:MAG TPA: tRNA preQ1(34) S-adenosylmethionine ribosyltransferase-isomerase QueA [Candidatus Latescibacteria bacterium]|nr:tRNA preQ1(34) S-adenosylmethionine ribosyltransferase-isomerase QueA [Candidatus Latescibacterota bacterium]
MKVDDFDYQLPEGLIAQHPVEPRDHARLMVLHRDSGTLEHRRFYELPRYLREGDVLVVNESKVFPARLLGRRPSGGRVELLLLRRLEGDLWEALARPGRRVRPGERLYFGGGELTCEVVERRKDGKRVVKFSGDLEAIRRFGQVPLPPYIRRPPVPEDEERYQTVYAKVEGSVAAPTAGLHFTEELLSKLREEGVKIVPVVLHVGPGTFRPVEGELSDHSMEQEYYEVTDKAAEVINEARGRGGRVVAVGTTSVRVLETVTDGEGRVRPGSGWTELFIYPPYRFKAVDVLITNFHLPRSTLLMLVAAFAGRRRVLEAYGEAVRLGYRFYSYGDAMLII